MNAFTETDHKLEELALTDSAFNLSAGKIRCAVVRIPNDRLVSIKAEAAGQREQWALVALTPDVTGTAIATWKGSNGVIGQKGTTFSAKYLYILTSHSIVITSQGSVSTGPIG
jgi:hypothetical protein